MGIFWNSKAVQLINRHASCALTYPPAAPCSRVKSMLGKTTPASTISNDRSCPARWAFKCCRLNSQRIRAERFPSFVLMIFGA